MILREFQRTGKEEEQETVFKIDSLAEFFRVLAKELRVYPVSKLWQE